MKKYLYIFPLLLGVGSLITYGYDRMKSPASPISGEVLAISSFMRQMEDGCLNRWIEARRKWEKESANNNLVVPT
jgi:hypothetical protein